jgi:hypothetical protein
MKMDWQTLTAGLIVAAAGFYLILRWRARRGHAPPPCCTECNLYRKGCEPKWPGEQSLPGENLEKPKD